VSDARLPPRAERTPVHRVIGISLELDRATLAGAHVEAAAGRALLAGRRIEDGDPRRGLLGLNHVGNQLLDVLRTAAGSRTAGTHSDELQEIATIEFGHSLGVPSSGM
jgi:hypothetical protein